jgi:hypothetical protein
MSYEVPLPMQDKLREKPVLNATELHSYLEKHGFKPMVVIIDNERARVLVYLREELGEAERLKLQEAIMDWYKKWTGVRK